MCFIEKSMLLIGKLRGTTASPPSLVQLTSYESMTGGSIRKNWASPPASSLRHSGLGSLMMLRSLSEIHQCFHQRYSLSELLVPMEVMDNSSLPYVHSSVALPLKPGLL